MRYLVGNWKMNLGPAEAQHLIEALKEPLRLLPQAALKVWVAPPSVSLAAACQAAAGSALQLGVQNIHHADKGAFTGEISVPMAREAGATFAIVGHSERRHLFGEPSEAVAKRALGALAQGMCTIVCCGETLAQREANQTLAVIESQLSLVRDNLDPTWPLMIAYEPVWAIGTGRTAALSDIQSAHSFIGDFFSAKGLPIPPILYGGSVTPDNVAAISSLSVVQGALVGGASLVAEKFIAMARLMA